MAALKQYGIAPHCEEERQKMQAQEKSVYNQFYSDLVTQVDAGISVPGTIIHCFYAEKMGKKYLQCYRQHFKEPDIHSHPMEHEELLLMHPQEWCREVCRCCEQSFQGGE